METRWNNALENNGTVQVKIELIYSGNSKRPDKFIIIETINGEGSIKHLKNTPTGE